MESKSDPSGHHNDGRKEAQQIAYLRIKSCLKQQLIGPAIGPVVERKDSQSPQTLACQRFATTEKISSGENGIRTRGTV